MRKEYGGCLGWDKHLNECEKYMGILFTILRIWFESEIEFEMGMGMGIEFEIKIKLD
jgi:hypothetical protein